MKPLPFIFLCSFLVCNHTFGQSSCSTAKVISPVVKKPVQDNIVSVTCSNLVVQWLGTTGQSYEVSATYYNTATKKRDTVVASAFSCNSSLTCTATIPVKAGTTIGWSVRAIQIINGRTFYSYALRGNQELLIPACSAPVTKAIEKTDRKDAPLSTGTLVVYPNPATNEITVEWNSNYKGIAGLLLMDDVGKVVKTITINKEQDFYTRHLTLTGIVAGLYYVGVKTPNGKMLTTRFIKELE